MVVVALNSNWICSNEVHHTDALTEPARMIHVRQIKIHGEKVLETTASFNPVCELRSRILRKNPHENTQNRLGGSSLRFFSLRGCEGTARARDLDWTREVAWCAHTLVLASSSIPIVLHTRFRAPPPSAEQVGPSMRVLTKPRRCILPT